MPAILKISNLKTSSTFLLEVNHLNNLNTTLKNSCLRKRLKKRHTDIVTLSNQGQGFKQNWFCKDCHSKFNLKPSPRYKTLLEYNLNCPNCNSENTAHNEELTQAIIENKPIQELLNLAAKGRHINVDFTGKCRHYVTFYNTSKEKEIENKEYYRLEPVN